MEFQLPEFSSPLIVGYLSAYFGMLLLALVMGEWKWRANLPERLMILAFAAAPFLQPVLYGAVGGRQFAEIDWVGVAIDGYLFAVALILAFTADRRWPYLAAPLLGYGLTTHIPRLVIHDWLGISYAVANAVPTMLAVVILCLGAYSNLRRRRKGEAIRDWVPYGKMASAWEAIKSSPTMTAIRDRL